MGTGSKAVIGITLALAAAGCGKGDGQAKLQFRSSLAGTSQLREPAGLAAAANETPTVFGIKMIAAYLSEDIDATTQNNTGTTAMIYLNPDCNEDISSCNTSNLTSFFEFAAPSATVNAALNAQSRSVAAGEYRYVRLEFCKYGAGGVNNFKFKSPSMSAAKEFSRDMCGVTSAKADPPIKVEAGKTVAISLTYDYANIVIDRGAGATATECDTSTGTSLCLEVPTFTPSFVTE